MNYIEQKEELLKTQIIPQTKEEEKEEETPPHNALRIFAFDSLHDIIKPAGFVTAFYTGDNYLYKDPEDGQYLLVVTRNNAPKESFNKTCNILSEYGRLRKGLASSHTYYEEHFERIAGPDALQKMSLS